MPHASGLPPLSSPSLSSLDRLTVFTFLWAVVRFFHLLSFPSWAYAPEWPSHLLLLAALLAMARPQWLGALVFLLAASLLRTLINMPFVPNHFWFECMMDGGILVSVLWRLGRGGLAGHTGQARENTFETFAPMARIGIIILYFYAVFHKINADYLTTPISCGTVLLDGLLAHLGIEARPGWANEVAVWGTLVVESAVAALLVWRLARRWAILLGMAFHFLLAVHPHPGLYSFTGLMFGYFFLFTPPAFTQWLAGWLQALRRNRAVLATGLAAGAAVSAGWLLVYRSAGFGPAAFVLWYGWCAVVFFIYGAYLLVGRVPEPSARLFAIRFGPLWVFLLAVVCNGLTPYLGLKTQISFSMFSNLRTENDTTNHLFMPHALLTHRWQDDLVAIRRTDHPELIRFTDGKRLLTHFELRRIVSQTETDFRLDYLRAGRAAHFERVSGVASDAELARPHPFLMDKFMRFRPVFTDTCRCQH